MPFSSRPLLPPPAAVRILSHPGNIFLLTHSHGVKLNPPSAPHTLPVSHPRLSRNTNKHDTDTLPSTASTKTYRKAGTRPIHSSMLTGAVPLAKNSQHKNLVREWTSRYGRLGARF